MQVRLLGPIEVVDDGGLAIAVGGPKERALWAMLALHANEVVSEDRLVDALWGSGTLPRTAVRTLQSYLSRLRRLVAEAGGEGQVSLESHPAGWTMRLDPEALDVARVHSLTQAGRSASAQGDHLGAVLAYADALRVWRGPSLGEFADEEWAAPEAARLEELRCLLIEERIDAELACGRHAELVGEIESLCRSYPLRERLWHQHMLALYRSGRQADALRAYQALRRTLGEELGIEPGPAVARLEQAILIHDDSLEWSPLPATRTNGPADLRPGPPAGGVVTVLFTDIVGSTELLELLGDDEYEAVRREHFATLRDVIGEAGGIEVKSLGDGVMAVFPSAVNAIGCAVTLQRAVARRNRSAAARAFSIRVGLHAGEPSWEDNDYYGTPVVVAKRLCDAGGPDEIIGSRLVADLVGSRGGFEFVDLGTLTLKGLAAPVAACSVAWTEEPRPSLPAPLAALCEAWFVGRGEETLGLDAAWQEARGGAPRVVLISGEPGIGKSTFAAHAANAAWGEGATVLFGRCDEESGVPFQPWVESIAGYAEATQPNDLRGQLGSQAADLALLVPAIARQLPEVAGVAGTGAESERYRVFDAVSALVGGIAAERPVVLVLDDLHWADRPTLQLLQHVIRRSDALPVLVVGTYRDTDLARTHPLASALAELRRAHGMRRLALRGLDVEDVIALVNAGSPGGDDEEAQLGRALWRETEGNPLFLRECLRHLHETGAVTRDDDGRWIAQRDIDELGIPEGVKEVIGRRLTRLSD
ncbi:MAG: AAA family ATPase, partial [Actinobacteria bacterium]|nr:AAA family ATPase [Actinomycetota bacterium]